MNRSQTIALVVAIAGFVLVASGVANNMSFMKRAAGVMTAEAASELGVTDLAGPWFNRVWFAPAGDGKFEVRPAAPVIGVIPFTSTLTSQDMELACKRLGHACRAV